MFKKDMTPLSKKGQLVKHNGKGAQAFAPRFANPMRNSNPGSDTINDYAKATPMAQPEISPLSPSEE